MEALLVFFDMKGPVAIKVAAQIDGSELDDGLGHLLRPAHSRTLHAIFDEIFAGAFDWPAGDRPALGEVLVITHAGAIAVKVLGDRLQGLAFCSEEAALSDALAKPLDDLADLSEQDAQGAIQHPEFGFQAPFSMKDIGGFPQFFQNV